MDVRPMNPMKVASARRALARVRSGWLSRPDVTGLDVGLRLQGDEIRDEIALRVWVRSKRPRSRISDTDCFPRQVLGVPVDVIEFDPQQHDRA